MAEEVMVFGQWVSPFSKIVEMGLKLKGVKYEYIQEDLKNKSPLLLKYNPIHKKVPILLHNGNPIAESLIILEYIDQVWDGPPIFPKDPYEKSKARFWAKFVQEKCMVPMWKACSSSVGEEREKAKEEAIEMLKFLEREIKGKMWFGGDNIGVVDITACFIAYWFPIIAEIVGIQILTQDKFPYLFKWADEFCNNSFFKEILPDREKLTARFKLIFQTGELYKHN